MGLKRLLFTILPYALLCAASSCLILIFALIWMKQQFLAYEANLAIRTFETALFSSFFIYGMAKIVQICRKETG